MGVTLLDARWAGIGGIGKVTRQLADGLGACAPAGDWLVWGSEPTLAWPGSRFERATGSPNAWAGQRAVLSVPSCDVAIFPANLRPLRPVGRSSLVILYDTIPLRHHASRARRRISRTFLRRAAALSTQVLTISRYSAGRLVTDLGVDPARIEVIPLPLDRALSDAVWSLRPESLSPHPRIVFLGRFLPHKNLPRLVDAFARSATARQGGELVLAGGVGPEVEDLRLRCQEVADARITVMGRLSSAAVVDLLASAWVLAVPSLEEGFGLPVVEGTAAGVPVVATTGGAIPEVVEGRLPLVDPRDVIGLSSALDEAAGRQGAIDPGLRAWARSLPDESDLAHAVLHHVGSLSGSRRN